MPLMRPVARLTVEWCLDCHRNPAPTLRPREKIFDTSRAVREMFGSDVILSEQPLAFSA
jgi:hypothetical protein